MQQAEPDVNETSTTTHSPAHIGAGSEPSLAARLSRTFKRARMAAEPALPAEDEVDLWAPLHRELSRSRRYERPFVLVRIDGDEAVATVGREGPEMLSERARRTREVVRDVDVAWVADGHVYVLLPECERLEGERFVERVVRDAPMVFSTRDVRLASFPEDGCTSGALLAVLEGHPPPLVEPRSTRLRAVGSDGHGETPVVAHGQTS